VKGERQCEPRREACRSQRWEGSRPRPAAAGLFPKPRALSGQGAKIHRWLLARLSGARVRALPGGQPRRFIMLTRRVGCRIHEGKWCAQRNRCLEAKGVRGLNAQWPSELRWRLRVKSRHICRFDNNDGFKAHHLALWIRQPPDRCRVRLAPSGPGHPVGFLLFLERFSSNYSH
jgi:hypothetical protein